MKMQENLLKRVRMIEEKHGIIYAKKDGKLYNALNVLYILTFIYTMAVNFIYIMGLVMRLWVSEDIKYSDYSNIFITVCGCTILLIVGLIIKKFIIASSALTLPSALFLMLTFSNISKDGTGIFGLANYYYFRHFIPLVLMIIFVVWMLIIALRADFKTKKQYKKVLDGLYTIFNNSGNELTDEQWQEFLNNYDPSNYKKLFKENEE